MTDKANTATPPPPSSPVGGTENNTCTVTPVTGDEVRQDLATKKTCSTEDTGSTVMEDHENVDTNAAIVDAGDHTDSETFAGTADTVASVRDQRDKR